MSEMINPYIAGAPVTEASMFFGREDVFNWIERSLPGRYVDHILVIHGQRRVGKTSVLKQLPHRLPERYIPVFFDLQGRTHTTLERFLWWLAREITRVLKQDHQVVIPMPKGEDFAEDPEYLEGKFLPSLKPHLSDQNLLLTFDEFDSLEEADIKQSLARPLIDYLRRLTGQEGLNFIFSIGSSGRKLENMQASYTEFFKTALYKEISFLGREDTLGLITQPVHGVLEYDRKAVSYIYQIASGHPYFTQLICHELFSRCQKTGETSIRQVDVETVLDDVIERGTVNLKFVWDEASDLEKWILASLAQMEGRIDTRALTNTLEKQRVRFSEQELNSAMLHMREKDVLTEDNRFVIHLLQIWLQKNRPLERVREELIEVNPIASRYIEIGLEYKDIQQFDKAIESFQEALRVDTENIQAQVNIGSVRLEQKSYAEAVAEYEKALSIDEEDVAARAGLCEAHIALGDQTLIKGRVKDAIRSYRQVLSINAEHTDARQRMADIYKQRAEAAVAETRFDQAFSDYRKALNYTPEDQALEARYAELLEVHREQVVKSLSVKAEKAIAAKRWDQAVCALDEAQHLAPEDEDLRQKLTEVRTAQRAHGLATLKQRAQQQTQTERWAEAIESWQAYLSLEPDDRQAAEAEIQRAQGEQKKSQAYDKARRAISSKEYDQAVQLLKGIVFEDETYKDASRLMAEAIELRRAARPFWKNKWLWGGVGSVAVIVLALILAQSNFFGPETPVTSTSEEAVMVPDMAAPAPILRATETPMLIPTPIPLAWTRLSSGQAFSRDTITAIVIDPDDPGVLYVGTENAGIYKSIDGGVSWKPVNGGLGRASINTLAIDALDPRVLYAGTFDAGIYKTSDSGATWHEANKGIDTPGWDWTSIVRMDPQDDQHLYYTHGEGIYESLDGGGSWIQIGAPYCPGLMMLTSLVLHPSDNRISFAASWTGGQGPCDEGVYTSHDGGQTWTLTGLQTDKTIEFGSLHIDYQDGSFLFASIGADGLYGSSDGGDTWDRLLENDCSAFAFSPDEATAAYCVTDQNLLETTDGGQSWKELTEHEWGETRAMLLSPHTPGTLFISGHGLYLSIDDGSSWLERNSGLGAGYLEMRIDPTNPSTLYVEMTDQRLYQSSDGGRSWKSIARWGLGLAFDASSGTLYRAGGDSINRSRDNGETWERIELPAGSWGGDVEANAVQSGVVYAVGYCGDPRGPCIYISSDGGNSWQTASVKEVDGDRIVVDPNQEQRVYVVGSRSAYRSNDGGETWLSCAQLDLLARYGSRMAIDPQDSDRLFLATRGEGVLISEDGCLSWHPKNFRLGNLFVNTVAIDPVNPDTIYAGTDGGAYVSFNDGDTWGEINNGLLGAMVVYSIVVDPEDPNNVYAATPYGIFKLESR